MLQSCTLEQPSWAILPARTSWESATSMAKWDVRKILPSASTTTVCCIRFTRIQD